MKAFKASCAWCAKSVSSMFVYNSLRNVTKSKKKIPSSPSHKMMSIPTEFMARRGSLESRQSPCEPPTKHNRTQSLKERLLSRKLPKIAPTSCDVIDQRDNRGLLTSRDGSVSSRSKAEDVDRKTTTTTSSSTVTR